MTNLVKLINFQVVKLYNKKNNNNNFKIIKTLLIKSRFLKLFFTTINNIY